MMNFRSMKICVASLVAMVSLGGSASVHAALNVTVGDFDLTANQAGQMIILSVTGGDQVTGMNLNLQVGNGASGPVVTGIDLITGTIFTGTPAGNQTDTGSNNWQKFFNIVTGAGTVAANGNFAGLTIDTTGLTGGRYGLRLTGVLGTNTEFIDAVASIVTTTYTLGSIAIGPNPSVIWNGDDATTNTNLTNHLNWLNEAAPLTGDSLHFAGTVGPAVNFDQTAGTNYNSITFDAGASVFTLSGNDIGLLNGGTVTNDSTASQIINLGITLADSATNTLDAKAGDINYTGTIAVGANGTLIFTDSVAGNNANHAVGNITGATGTVKNTAGNLTLAGTNTFGTLTVDAGSAVFEGGAAMSDTGTVNLNGTSTLILTNDGAFNSMTDTLTANTETVGSVNAVVGSAINLNNNILIITGSSMLAGTITDAHNPVNADANGEYEIGFAGGLVFNTDAAVSISGNNTFALGGIIGNANIASALLGNSLTAPTVTLGHDMALGTGGFTFNNGTLIASGNRTLANGFQIGGNVIIGSGGNLVITGDINLDGIAGDEEFGVDLTATARTFTVQNNTTFSGTVIGTKTFNKLGSGTLTLSGDNNTVTDSFTGDFGVNEGILKITGDNSAAGNVTVNTGSFQVSGGNAVNDASTVALGLTGADFQVQGSETISKLSGVTGSTVQLLNGSILTTGATAGGLLADTTFAGVISGNGGLTINADAQMDPNPPGIVTLSGANTYTGITTINSGALLVAGSINASDVTVNNTGIFGGDGTVNSDVVIANGGELVATNSTTPTMDGIETFTLTGNVTVNTGGALSVDIGSTGGTQSSDLFNITGTLTLASGAILDIANIGSDLIVAGNTFNFASVGIFNNQGATLTESVAKIGFNLVNNGGMLNLVAFEVLDATWTAGTSNFSTTTNWDNHPDGVPMDVAGLGLIFTGADGAAAIAVNADAGPYTNIESITFADSATATNTFTLSGSSLGFSDSLTASITNNTVRLQTINNPLSTGADLLDINAASGDLQLNGAINTNISGLNALGSNNTTISGIVSGSGVLNVNGSGMLILSAANTYTGPTIINSGTLAISNTGSVTSNVTLTNGILSLGNDNAINAANTLTLNGGTLNASGDRMLTNAVNLGGDVIFSGNGTTLSGAITNTGINTLTINNTQTTLSGNITGGGLIKSGASDLSLSGSNTLTSLDINAGKVFIKNANALTNATAVNLTTSGAQMALSGVDLTVKSLTGVAGTTVSISGQTLTIAGSDMTTFAGVITNPPTGNLLYTGSGTQTLAGANDYVGTTTVDATATGTLAITGSVAGDVILQSGGGTLLLDTDSIAVGKFLNIATAKLGAATDGATIANGVGINGNTTFSGTNALNLTGAIDLNGQGGMIKRTLTVQNVTTLSGAITDGGIIKEGSGQLNLSGDSGAGNFGFTDGVTLNQGTLGIGHDNALGTGTFTINGGTITALANGVVSNAVVVGGDFAVTGDNNATLGGSVDLGAATRTITVTGNGVTTLQNITNGDLIKEGSGTVTLAGTTTNLTNGLTVNAGTVNLNSTGALHSTDDLTLAMTGNATLGNALTIDALNGTGTGTLNLGSSVLAVNSGTVSNVISGDGTSGLTKNSGSTLTLNGVNTYGGGTTLAAGKIVAGNNAALGTGTLTVSGASTLEAGTTSLTLNNNVLLNSTLTAGGTNSFGLSGVISGANGLTKNDANTLTLSNANTYTGPTAVNGGTLALSGGTALADTNAVTVANGATLQVDTAETIGSLAGVAGSSAVLNTTLTTGGNDTNTQMAGVVSGSGGLTKKGTGTFTLSGTNTYTGTTMVDAGTLALTGGAAILDTAAVDVTGTLLLNNSETLGDISGSGTVNNNGNALTFGNNAGTTFSGDLAGSGAVNYNGSNTFVASGTNTFTGNLNVNAGTVNLTGSALNSNTINITGGKLRSNNAGNNALSNTAAINATGTGNLQIDTAETVGQVDTASTATLIVNNNLTLTGANTSTLAGNTSGAGSIFATNNAMLDLSGTSTSSITGNTNATIDLTGTASNITIDSTSKLISGAGAINTTAMLTGNLVLNAGSILGVDISNNTGTLTSDTFTVTGNATLADNSIVAITDVGPTMIVTGNSFDFLTYGGTLTATQNANVLDQVKLQESLSTVAFQLTDNDAGTLTLTAVNVSNVTWDGGAGSLGLWSNTTNWDDDVNGVTFNNTAPATFDLEGQGLVFSGATNNGGTVIADAGMTAATSYSNIASIGFSSTSESFALTGLDLNLANGQTVDISNDSANNHSIANNITTGDNTTTIAANTANLTLSGTVTNTNGIVVTGVSDTTVTGTIAGAGSLSKTGTGTLNLNTANTHTGGTSLTSGTLNVGDDAALGSGTLTLSGGTLNATGVRTLSNAVTLNGDAAFSGSNVTLSGAVTNTGINTLTINNTQTTLSGDIAGGGLGKSGAGELVLSGSNTLTNLNINAGKVTVSNANALTGITAVDLTMAGAQLDMSGVALTIDSLTGVAGTIVDTIGNKLTIDGSSTTEFAGVITNLSAGQLILDAAHSGQLTLSGANTYNGATTISGGTLVIANTGSVDGNVVVNGGTFVIGSDTAIDDADSLIINAGNLQSDNDSRNLSSGVDFSVNGNFAVTGTNDLQLSGNVDLNAGTRTLTTTDAANTTTLSGIISSGGITKAGAGELLLTGANTYANETTLNAGTLTLGNNTALGSGALRINAGTLASNNNLRMLANAVSVYGDFAVGGSNNLALTGSVNLSGGDADHTATISNNTTLAGNLTGGDLTKAGAGALTLTGTNSFATGLTITAGTLNIDSSNALSAADNLMINGGLVDVNAATLVAGLSGTGGTLNVDATLAFGDANDKSLASTITGAAAIQKIGTGKQTLTGDNNSFSGGFTVNLGTLAVGHTNALGNSMTSDVILNGGTLASALDNVTVANNIGLTANSNIEADTNMDMILSGIISGSFAVNKTGAGTLQLEGANTFNTLNLTAGNVVLNNGASNALSDTSAVDITGSTSTLQLNHNETIGSLAGVAGSTVNLQSNTLTTGDATALTNFAGALTGTGGLTKMGTGNFLLSGTNTFTGDVNLNAGLLTLSGGSALADTVKVRQTAGTTLALINNETIGALAGDGSVALGANTLGIGGSIDTTYAGIISGAGGLNYNSTGILTLSNTNTFTGATNVNSGTLNLDGTTLGANNVLTGNVNVNGGSLTGNGNIGGNLNIFSGMLSPGNSAGIINVAGNFSLASAATYLAEIDYAGTGNATTVDMLAATGSITLANGSILQITLADVDDEAVEGDKHILATGSSIIDNGLTIDEPALIDLSYTTMGGTLEITIVNLLNFEEATANSVNPAIGTALVAVAAASDNNNADAQALLVALDNLTETQLNAFVEQVNNSANGSSLGSQTITQLVQTFNQVLAGHLASRRSNLPVYAQQGTGSQLTMLAGLTDDPHTLAQVAANEQNSQQKNEEVRMAMPMNEWAAFGKIYGIFSDQDTTSNRTGYSANGVGVQFGMDYQINENWLVGLAFDYAKTDVTLDSGLGSIDVDSFRIGPFASYFNDNWYVDLNLTYGLHNNDAVRNVIATGAVDATYDAYDISMYIGGGYQFKLNEAWTLTPTGSLRYTYYNREAYSETGTGALTYGEYDTSTLHSRLGAKLTYQMQTAEILFIPEVVLGWEHEYLDDNDAVSAAFVSGGAFTVSSGNPDQNSIFFGAGLTAIIEEQWTTFVRYEGNVSDNGGTHSITGGVRFDF